MTPTLASPAPLDRRLPAALVGEGTRVFGYRNYPVFGFAWFWRRSVWALVLVGGFALLTGLSLSAIDTMRDHALGLALAMFGAFIVISCAGPALATLVRHARWPRPVERVAVVGAILLGILAGYHADHHSSAYAERVMRPALESSGNVRVVVRRAETPPYARSRIANTTLRLAFYAWLGGLLALRAYFVEDRRLRELDAARDLAAMRRRAEEADLRLGLLQAQVEPHFLFNTLASVRALLRQDPVRAEATLDALVDHLRATIPRLRDGEAALHSTLGQQLDICASYLAVMTVRMGDRLSCAVEADDDLRARPFPPLLLITLVENAIKHGIEPKPGPGRIEVRASRRGDRLVASVVDDGAGLQPGLGGGVGLANVREQLSTRYGGQATFSLRSLAGQGAVAEIVVPLEPAA